MRHRSEFNALLAAWSAVALLAIATMPACHGTAVDGADPVNGQGSAGGAGGNGGDEIGAVWAECQVCRCNCDLACVRVRVEPTTPRAEIGGVTWYFCSEECRDDFVAHSQKYLAH